MVRERAGIVGKKLIAMAAGVILLMPMFAVLAVAVLIPPATASCAPTGFTVTTIPDTLEATMKDGTKITLDHTQLGHAATIITTSSGINGVGRDGIIVALMTALTESSLRMLANTDAYPESTSFPHDGDSSDHDSLGLFQMRPQAAWGTVAQLMDPVYQVRAFLGGTSGPNNGSPRGLLDIPDWKDLTKSEAAQGVEVSAYPDRYENYEPVAEAIFTTLTSLSGSGNPGVDTGGVAETSRIVFPLPEGTWVDTSSFGWRTDPLTGEQTFHAGSDYAAPDGTPIMAIADGKVISASHSDTYGGIISIQHTIDGKPVVSIYIHMWQSGIHVTTGQTVTAGQHIADVGSSGRSTGPHLHLEIHPGGENQPPVNASTWLTDHHAEGVNPTNTPNPGCNSSGNGAPAAPFTGENPNAMVEDPTTNGQITALMHHVLGQTQRAFPDTGWSCYSPRPGQKSEHSLGRACDVTFGNTIGTKATGAALSSGWNTTNWLITNAETLGIYYLIWQGHIWLTSTKTWEDYNGGGMHDPTDITGGHYDHLHISVD